MARVMSDAEIKRRKRVQGHVSQATGALGLAALGGTLAASRGGRNTLRKIPALRGGSHSERAPLVRKPKPLEHDRDKISGGVTPVLATSAGLGGIGSFNFAAYTGAESRKRKTAVQPKKPVVKSMDMEMGYYGDVGHELSLDEIEKAWSPTTADFDAEAKRHKRGKAYESGALAGAGAGGLFAAQHGTKAVKEAKNLKPSTMAELEDKRVNGAGETRKVPVMESGKKHGNIKEVKAYKVGALKPLRSHGGKAAAGLAVAGAGVGAHSALRRKRKTGSWKSYD